MTFTGIRDLLDEVTIREEHEEPAKTGVCETCSDILEPDSDSDYCRHCLGLSGQDAYWTKAEMNEEG